MEKRVRRVLFVIFFLIFIIVAPILILYVQGYRFDFENKKLTQTGGLFIKTTAPKQAEIYLDEELIRKTDFFFSSALIENLLPKTYNIKVQKQDYYAWEKNLEVKEKQVVEARSIVLLPKDPEFELLATEVENIWFSEDKTKAIIKETDNNIWTLKLYNLEKNVRSQLIKETDIYKTGADLIDLHFTNNDNLMLQVGSKEQVSYFELEIDSIPPLLTKAKAPQPLIEDALAYESLNGAIYYLDSLGDLYKTNASLTSNEKITSQAFNISQETEYKLYIFEKAVFIQEGKTIHLLNQEKKIFEQFSENIKSLKISPDKRKVVYFSDSEIKILFLEEQNFQPRFSKGENMFLIRLSEPINDIFWLNSDYLILITNNVLKIIEIDNRDRVNIIEIVTVKNPEIFLNRKTKKFYLLDRGNFFVSEKIII
ncbi:MAG: hypothetical protein ACKKMW_03080 [Candidatus Nealsonbacteria bacterium]